MKQVYEKKEKNKRANAAILAALVFSLALIGGGAAIIISGFVVGNVAVTQLTVLTQSGALNIVSVTVLDTTGVDVGNTTDSMMTLFITLISVMIPLIIIMAYLGIFQDFLAAISKAFSGMFRH